MPFGSAPQPSIALTQLKSVVDRRFPGEVSVEICCLNHDVGRYLGLELYSFLVHSTGASMSGLGDWYFRQCAFPDLLDNADEYFRRYFPQRSGPSQVIREAILEKRPQSRSMRSAACWRRPRGAKLSCRRPLPAPGACGRWI